MVRPTVKIRKPKGGLAALERAVKAADGLHAKVGVFGGGHRKIRTANEPRSNLELAIIHEFGSSDGRIPERSFIRSTFAEKRDAYQKLLRSFVRKGFQGASGGGFAPGDYFGFWKRVFGVLGQRITADIKNRITTGDGIPPPLAPSTIERKGSERPLVDTGQLLNSITYEVAKEKK